MDPVTVADVDEDALLARILPQLPAGPLTLLGPGDDAAVLGTDDGRYVVSSDMLVEGVHFRLDWSTGYDVGWRAVVQNLADIAAMGAAPMGLTIALALPPTTALAWVEDFARGLGAACERHGTGVVGGDLTSGPAITVGATVFGELFGLAPVTRAGARPGDQVAVAGTLGRSAAGLALHLAGLQGLDADLAAAYLRPSPPIEAGLEAGMAGATAMMDISDGLVRDATRLARASRCRIDLRLSREGESAPDAFNESIDADLAALEAAAAAGADPFDLLLTGGEDHGMLATFPPGAPLPAGFRQIGWAIPPAPGPAVLVMGRPPTTGSGWDHFRRA